MNEQRRLCAGRAARLRALWLRSPVDVDFLEAYERIYELTAV
jgi:hypothetical protein